ncbi:MAG: aminoglycoside phosphotransferase family protein [Armatimonadetes bacterium]|nr:aminoglycoside phosphotransferase family protein [Armatimonadota bacterium]
MDKRTDPTPEGLAAMAAELGPAVHVVDVRPLTGGAMAVDLIELTEDDARRDVVLKRFPLEAGAAAENEWDALCFAHSVGLPSPAPLSYNAVNWFGAPSIVMSALPGSPCHSPTNLDSWAASLAETLVAIHSAADDALPATLRRPGIWNRWDGSSLPPGPRRDAIVLALTELRARSWHTSFCHCDFHPGNVLFRDGAVVGVVDWPSAKLSPLLNDIGRLRAAVAVWPGGNAPDLVATAYEERSGRSLEGLAYWDLLAGAVTWEAAMNGRVAPYLEGMKDSISTPEVAERASAYVDAALARIEVS